MSTVYQQEPPTSGRVVLHTNYGPIELDLWSSEAPKASRNFIQLSLEGYYDGTLFHRVIPGFMVQGGDPSGTGKGGQSIYAIGPESNGFADEFHTRLKFNHRGILAMANESKPNTNQSQFFMTVDACPWLDRKHTIFGKVEGPTLFNLLKISELEVDPSTDRPISDPLPRILRVEVVSNPFDDIVPRNIARTTVEKPLPLKEATQKPVLANTNLLSFE